MSNESIVDITLRIWGEQLRPNEITDYLQVNPTKVQTKGKITSPGGKTRTVKTGMWALKITNSDSLKIEEALVTLINILQNSKHEIKKCAGVEGTVITIILGVAEDSNSIEFRVRPDLMRKISDLGVEIAITVI